MSKKAYIKKAVEKFVAEHTPYIVNYTMWHIGIAADKMSDDQVCTFAQWKADSVKEAKDILRYFSCMGMAVDAGRNDDKDSKYVYIYKAWG